MAAKYLITENLAQLLQEHLNDPDLEAEYRRGFTDCAGAFFQHLDDLPTEIDTKDLIESVWLWYVDLMRWQQTTPPGESKEPPAFRFQRGGLAIDCFVQNDPPANRQGGEVTKP